MEKIWYVGLMTLLHVSGLYAAGSTPIMNLKLIGDADANNSSITNLSQGTDIGSAATIGQMNDTNTVIRGTIGIVSGRVDVVSDQVGVVSGRVDVVSDSLSNHTGDLSNPHIVTLAQLGLPLGGCADLGTGNSIVLDGSYVYYRAAPTTMYTVTVSQVVGPTSWTYCLTTYSSNTIVLANASLRNTWTLGATNTLVFYPGETNAWFVKGSAP